MLKVLVVDGFNRSGLAVARALKMAGGYKVYVTSPTCGRRDTLLRKLKSKAVEELIFTSKQIHLDSFTDELKGLIRKHGIDALIPVGQAAAVSVAKAKPKLEGTCKVLIEDYEKILQFHDKGETAHLLEELEIPHPSTFIPDSLSSLKSYADTAEYPVVIKARKGMGSTGIWYAGNREELIRVFRTRTEQETPGDDGLIMDSSNPIIQEYIPGALHDSLVFCVEGKVKAGLTQKRLVTRPQEGGVGIVNVTTRKPELLDYAERLASHTRWSGVMMLDFKIDGRDGKPRLLEVNPRFWGTTWLSIVAGINFPHYLASQAFNLPVSYPEEYETGLTCRWILDELAGVFDPPLSPGRTGKRMAGFFKRFGYRPCRYDIMLSDLKPFFGDIIKSPFSSSRKSSGM